MTSKITLEDIAQALGLSVGTVHRAIHGHPGVSAMKKARVLQMARTMGYTPNLAARYLRSKHALKISVITPKEIASFYDPVRAGVDDESGPACMTGVEVHHRKFARLGVGEEDAFDAALEAKSDGIIVVPGNLVSLEPWIRRASRARVPVVCLINDGPGTDKLAAVSVDTTASGAMVAELIGRFLGGTGKVAVTCGDMEVPNHREKVQAFESTLGSMFPAMPICAKIENHESESEAYDKTADCLWNHRDVAALYVSTGNGAPVLRAVEDAGRMGEITIVATDLFAELVPRIERGQVAAAIYERPYSQGRLAFRILHDFLVNGNCPSVRVTLAPLLVMRSNLGRFLQQEYLGTENRQNPEMDADRLAVAGDHML